MQTSPAKYLKCLYTFAHSQAWNAAPIIWWNSFEGGLLSLINQRHSKDKGLHGYAGETIVRRLCYLLINKGFAMARDARSTVLILS